MPDQANHLLVEMEIGQHTMPKPLLSGYFTNHLNSVRNVKEVQKSLEDTNMCMSQGSKQNIGSLNDINEDDEIPHSEM